MSIATSDDLSPGIEALEIAQIIEVAVLNDMRLLINPVEIARGGEHNSATFRIVQQPNSLDGYVCRAEVQTSEGTTYRLVIDGEFELTSDISVPGIGQLQLVYSDGDAVIRKTYPARFHVTRSLNAVDESDPEFQNGLGQMQAAAFTQVIGSDTEARFFNISGGLVATLAYPPGQGGGLDEATANLLYLRLDGASPMQASLGFNGPSRGVTWEDAAQQGALYSTGTQLVMRRALNNTPIVIEDNSGAPATRSPILTEAMGDQRYPTLAYTETAYARLAGANFTGPIITAPGSGLTNPGIGIGDNATGFYRAGTTLLLSVGGALYAQWLGSPASVMFTVPLNMATYPINNVGTPGAATDAANRAYVDNAVAAIPQPTVPAARAFIANEVTINQTAQSFFNQPFFTNDNSPRTILITVYPQFAGGTGGAFYDLEYSTNLSVGLVERSTVYPTAQGYMGGGQAICFAVTVTPVSSQILVGLSVREISNNPNALTQIGSGETQRSYVVIQEMTN